jgi:hypothetical protein
MDDDDPCANGVHCCCCGPGDVCCDCGETMPDDYPDGTDDEEFEP